jgi:hypothetical protein
MRADHSDSFRRSASESRRFGALLAIMSLSASACNCGGDGAESVDGRLVIAPGSLDFGSVSVGLAAQKPLVLSNAGKGLLQIDGAMVSDSIASDVRLEGVPAAIAPSEGHAIAVIFTPATPGPRDGALVFTTNSRITPSVSVRTVGLAIEPRLIAIPPQIDFGRVVLGQVATASASIENTGDDVITVDTVTLDVGTSSEFSTGLSAIRTLHPGDSFVLRAEYAPMDLGVDQGRIVVDDDTMNPQKLGLAVRGEGVFSEIEIDPLMIDFDGLLVGERTTRAFEIRNIGARAHTITELALTSTSSEISIDTSSTTVPFVLPANTSRFVGVTYAPADAIDDSGTVHIAASGLPTPQTVLIRGHAELRPRPLLVVSPTTIDFGSAQTGTGVRRRITLRNDGDAALHLVSALAIAPQSSPFALVDLVPPSATIAPGDALGVDLDFLPSSVGPAASAGLTIASDDPSRPLIVVQLQGLGGDHPEPDLFVRDTQVLFGRVPRGVLASRSLVVTNDGSAPLSITGVTLPMDAGGRFARDSLPPIPLTLVPGASAKLGIRYLDPLGLAGDQPGLLRIDSDDPDNLTLDIPLDAETTAPPFGSPAFELALSWDTAADLDLHLVRVDGAYFGLGSDCCFCDPNPDWGVIGSTGDDPFLDRDVINGFGPERIVIWSVAQGAAYAIAVHDYDDRGASAPAQATVTVRSNGVEIGTVTRAITQNERWDVGTLSWPDVMGVLAPSALPLAASSADYCR